MATEASIISCQFITLEKKEPQCIVGYNIATYTVIPYNCFFAFSSNFVLKKG